MNKTYSHLVEVDVDVTVLADVLAESFDEACERAKQRATASLQVNETKLCRLITKTPSRYESDVKVLRDWEEYMIQYPVSVKMAALVYGVDEDRACSRAEEMVRQAIEVVYPCTLAELAINSFTCHYLNELAVVA